MEALADLDNLENGQRALEDRINPLQLLSDEVFKNRCRMSKATFRQLIRQLAVLHRNEKPWVLLLKTNYI